MVSNGNDLIFFIFCPFTSPLARDSAFFWSFNQLHYHFFVIWCIYRSFPIYFLKLFHVNDWPSSGCRWGFWEYDISSIYWALCQNAHSDNHFHNYWNTFFLLSLFQRLSHGTPLPPPRSPTLPDLWMLIPGAWICWTFSILRWCVDDVMPAWWLFGRLPWDSIGPHIAKCSNDFCNSLWQCNPLHSIRSRRTWPLPAQWRLKLFPTELKRCHKS